MSDVAAAIAHELAADQTGRPGDQNRHTVRSGCSLKKWLLRNSSTAWDLAVHDAQAAASEQLLGGRRDRAA